jgi:hypothetical protein
VEPLRPPTPNPTGTATVEPLLPDPLALGSAPLYPQFLRPLGAEPLTVNDPNQFFPDGVPGLEPATNPYATSPFFPAIPEPVAPAPIANPIAGVPQLPPTQELQSETLTDNQPEAALPQTIPVTPAGAALQIPEQGAELPNTPTSNAPIAAAPVQEIGSDATAIPPVQAGSATPERIAQAELPAEPSTTIPPQFIRETQVPAQPPSGMQAPVSQPEVPAGIVPDQLVAPIQPENITEPATAPQFGSAAQNLRETPEAVANIPAATAQSLQEENLETSPAPAIPQQTSTADTPQPSLLSEQTPIPTTPVDTISAQVPTENAPQSIPGESRPIPEATAPAFSQSDRLEQDRALNDEAVASPETLSESRIPAPTQTQIPEITPVSEPASSARETATEDLEVTSEVTAPETPEVLPSVATTETLGVVPAQTTENLVTLPESSPQVPDRENPQAVSEQVIEETPETASQSLPDARSAESPEIASELLPETIPVASSEIPSEQIPESVSTESSETFAKQTSEAVPRENLEAISQQVPEVIPAENPETISRQAPETAPVEDSEISPKQIPEGVSTENLEISSEQAPESSQVPKNIPAQRPETSSEQVAASPVAAAPLISEANLEEDSERIIEVASPETSVVSPDVVSVEVTPESPVVSSELAPQELPAQTPQILELPAQNLEAVPTFDVEESESDSALSEQTTTALAETATVLPEQSPEAVIEPLGQTPAETIAEVPERSAALSSQDQAREQLEISSTIVPEVAPESSAQVPELSDVADNLPTESLIPATELAEERTVPTISEDAPSNLQPAALIASDGELPVQTQQLPTISENADLQEQAQALYGALANRLEQLAALETPELASTDTLPGQEPEAATDLEETIPTPEEVAVPTSEITPESAAPIPETSAPTPSLADLSAQLDEEGQTALTNLVSQSDGVTPPPADLLATVTDRLPPDTVPALENILQSGLLPVAETPQSETQLPATLQPETPQAETQALATQLPENQRSESQPLATQVPESQPQETELPENLPTTASTDSVAESSQENVATIVPPATPIISGNVPAEAPQDLAPQAEPPPANFRGAAALAAFQSLPMSMLAQEASEEPEVPESPTVEPGEIAPEASTPTLSAPEDAVPQIPDQPTATLDPPAQTTAELDGLQPDTPQTIEPLGQVESPQLLDAPTQPIQDEEEGFPLPEGEDAEVAPLSPNLGLGSSPFLPTALDNLSTFTPLDATEPSSLPSNFQNFAPLTFAPPPQSPVGTEDTPQLPTTSGQSPSVIQPQLATPPLEEPQITEAPTEPVSNLSDQPQEVQLPSQTQDIEQPQESPLPSQVQEIEPVLEPETLFPPATMVGTPADQEEAAFLGSMFAAAEPLGQAALDSLVQMPEARQLEISNALPLARRPAQLAETPTPQAPTQQLQTSAPIQPFSNIPDQESFEQPVESELAFEGDQQPAQLDTQTFSPPAAPTYSQATTPLKFVNPQTTPQTFEQTTPASPAPGYVQSDQPLVYRPASTPQPDSSLADETKPVIDQSGIEEMLNLGTDNQYQEPESPSFEDETSTDDNDTPLGQLFRQGIEKGPPLQRDITSQEPEQDASPMYTMEAPGNDEDDDDDDDISVGSGASIESLARQIYQLVRHRLDREKERHGGHQDRGGW